MLKSFFACGDFNQRITGWGTRSVEQLKWASSGIAIRNINIAYRQSKQLNSLAGDIIRAANGVEQQVNLPAHVNNDGVMPVLLEYATGDTVISWLVDRICEIDCFVEQFPSTAVFVNSENEVAPTAALLKKALAEYNINVTACHAGQAVGQDSNVRVFDIQHIKGLEFEAVFFTNVDLLAERHPDLFDKYLYVGATRAATYLGVTCENKLPPVLQGLQKHFSHNWEMDANR